MNRIAAVMAFALCVPAFAQSPLPRTTAEATEYRETTKHAAVVAFGDALAKQFPAVKSLRYGTSKEGKLCRCWC